MSNAGSAKILHRLAEISAEPQLFIHFSIAVIF
jgi:hypothetical protein